MECENNSSERKEEEPAEVSSAPELLDEHAAGASIIQTEKENGENEGGKVMTKANVLAVSLDVESACAGTGVESKSEVEAIVQETEDDEANCKSLSEVCLKDDEVKNQLNVLNENSQKTALDDMEKPVEIMVCDEAATHLQINIQKDEPAAEVDPNISEKHPILIVDKSCQEAVTESKVSEAQKASDDKALSENITSKTLELMESIDMDNGKPESSSRKSKKTKVIRTKKDKNVSPTGLGLSLLAQYNSDSDADCEGDDDVVEVPIEANQDYRNRIVEIMSESESESTTSHDSDVEYLTTIRKEIEKNVDFDDDDDDDDDCGGDGARGSNANKKKHGQMRVKGELLLEDLPPIQDLHITVPEEECVELGRVHSIVDQLLLVSVIPDSLLLDLDTVLFLDKGKKVLGEVFDVLGQVADPMYCVRFNSHKEIEEKGIKIGDTVYVAPKTKYTQFVILSSLMKLRGSDASWENDIEPPPRYLDYSDDEQEREARARMRNKDRPNDHDDPIKRSRNNAEGNSSSSSPTTSNAQKSFSQRSGRFNQGRTGQIRPPYQYPNNEISQNAPHTGSWHSNYRHSYSSFHNAQRGPQMPLPYQPYPGRPYPPVPQMSPTPPPGPLPMYVPNPMAVRPDMFNNRLQYHSPQQTRMRTHSPPPAPPGLD